MDASAPCWIEMLLNITKIANFPYAWDTKNIITVRSSNSISVKGFNSYE